MKAGGWKSWRIGLWGEWIYCWAVIGLIAGAAATAAPDVEVATDASPRAQSRAAPYLAVVTVPQVVLRAGPSDQFPETGTLQAGMTVWVDHEEENGWLAVQDPPQTLRSISWVPLQFINFDKQRPIPQHVVVDEGGAPLRAGRIGLAEPLAVQRTRVPGGTILLVVGPPVQREGRTWYPVAAPPGDFRYLPRQAVRPASGGYAFRVREPQPTPANATPAASPAATSQVADSARPDSGTHSKPVVDHPLWQQAEAAEQAGRYDEAERLYFELARQMNATGGNHDIANLCYTRIHTLREKRRSATPSPPPSSPLGSSRSLPTVDAGPAGNLRNAGGGQLEPVQPAGGSEAAGAARWHGPGRLVRAAIALDGRKTYALESQPGVVIAYVVAGNGIDLDRYLNTLVRVYGPLQSRRGLSYSYVTAAAVEAASR